jgi:transposase
MGRTRQLTFNNSLRRCVSQLPDNFDVRFTRYYFNNCSADRMRYRHSCSNQTVIQERRHKGFIPDKAAWPAKSGQPRVFAADARSGADQSAYAGVWFFHMVRGAFGRASGQGNRDSFQQRSTNQTVAPTRFFSTSSQAYIEGQARRSCLREGQETPCSLEKKAMKPNAKEALVFQDETEIHRHPTLTRMWGLKGIQPEVPSPGENQKKVVYGGIDYTSGQITYTVADTKSGYNFLAFLITLVTAYAGCKIRLVCDNGRFHHTRAVKQWLKAHRDIVQIFWLPPYCPSLNLIERLWGHLKRTVLANVLFETMNDLVTAFCRGVSRINGHKNKMGFIFDHDDVKTRAA